MSLQPEKSDASHAATPPQPGSEQAEYSPEERATLLKLAHDSIRSALEGGRVSTDAPTAHLREHRGAFTTLYVNHELRGCVGYVYPVSPLYQTIAETSCAAAFEDTRFPPLQSKDLSDLTVSISVLSPLAPAQPEEVQVGRHGLLVSQGGRRGLLLPQVPLEHGWDRTTFLDQTCRKAGLPEDAWRRGASIEIFTAEIFSDPGTKV
jgi:AmmeMemoRadiSam system protein A